MHSFHLYIPKKEEKKILSTQLSFRASVDSFSNIYFQYKHSVLLPVIYFFQFFSSFFVFLVHVNMHKLCKSKEQLYCYLEIPKTGLHWVNVLSSKQAGFRLLSISCTQHIKQNKQRNKNFKRAIQFLAIATYT